MLYKQIISFTFWSKTRLPTSSHRMVAGIKKTYLTLVLLIIFFISLSVYSTEYSYAPAVTNLVIKGGHHVLTATYLIEFGEESNFWEIHKFICMHLKIVIFCFYTFSYTRCLHRIYFLSDYQSIQEAKH